MADRRARKPKRRQEHRDEDAFVDAVLRLWGWAQQNARTVVTGIVALVLLAAGALYYVNYRATVKEQAATELQDIRDRFGGDPGELRRSLEAFVQRYAGTPSAEEGGLLLARLQLDFGEPDRALQTLEPLLGRAADTPVGHGARIMSAAAYAALGELERALELLEESSRAAQYPFQRRAARAERARILTSLGRLSEAAAIYEALVEETSDPAELSRYRLRLGELRARLAAGGSGAAAASGGAAEEG